MARLPFSQWVALAAVLGVMAQIQTATGASQWPETQAQQWQAQQPWLAGCNFGPSSAINQLEMWQADTFDTAGIDRELSWAEGLGFTCVRVFLHDLLWKQDAEGFGKRMDQFLEIADRHHIKVMFVLLDSCWDPFPKLGKQRDPKPHVHNSGWVQSPGLEIIKNPARHGELEGYVKGVLSRYRDDRRVVVWDLINEPDNRNSSSYQQFEPENKEELSVMLLTKVFGWAREINPSQPLTSGVWQGDWSDPQKLSKVNRFMLDHSDIISFHNYAPLAEMKTRVESLKRYKRPLVCTEYMARPAGSTFQAIMPYLKAENIGAINWGFVAGKTQTIYPWDSWKKQYTAEPPLWFHDIFRKDGTVYDQREVDLIRKLTGKGQGQ
jgi:hypothetical protein